LPSLFSEKQGIVFLGWSTVIYECGTKRLKLSPMWRYPQKTQIQNFHFFNSN